jgi:hypothetical protein
MSEVDNILDVQRDKEKKAARATASQDATIKAGRNAVAELGLNLRAGCDADAVIAAGEAAKANKRANTAVAGTPISGSHGVSVSSTGSSITTTSATGTGKGFFDPMELIKANCADRTEEKKRKREHKLQMEKEKTRQLELKLQLAKMNCRVEESSDDDNGSDEDQSDV